MSIRFVEKIEDANIATHGGKSFHGDDIFGIAFLELFLGDVNCFRIPYNEYCSVTSRKDLIVFDTGGGKFDHHQKGGNGKHPLINKEKEPIPYASFGLLWDEFGLEFLKNRYQNEKEEFYDFVFKYVDYHLVRAIDASDNGIFPNMVSDYHYPYRVMSLSCVISFLNPDEIIKDSENKGLEMALKLAKKALLITLKRAEGNYNYRRFFEMGYDSKYSNEYDNTISKCLAKELRGPINEMPDLPHFDDNYKTETKIEKTWIKYSDAYFNEMFDEADIEFAQKQFSAIIYGFSADCMGIGQEFSQSVDEMDCATLRTIFDSKNEYGEGYEEDLSEIFHEVFMNTQKTAKYKIDSRDYVQEQARNTIGHVLVLLKKSYWQDWVANMPEAKKIWFVISPTDNGTWKINPIPCKYNENGYKMGFPKKWFGYSKSLDQKNGKFDKDVVFIHSSGFLAVCKTLNSALKLTKMALENQENRPIEMK